MAMAQDADLAPYKAAKIDWQQASGETITVAVIPASYFENLITLVPQFKTSEVHYAVTTDGWKDLVAALLEIGRGQRTQGLCVAQVLLTELRALLRKCLKEPAI
jgi:hypothetical protein